MKNNSTIKASIAHQKRIKDLPSFFLSTLVHLLLLVHTQLTRAHVDQEDQTAAKR